MAAKTRRIIGLILPNNQNNILCTCTSVKTLLFDTLLKTCVNR